MKKLFKISTFFFLLLGLVGCGESSPVGTASALKVATGKQVELNGNKMGIDFSVESSYPSDVNVSVTNLKVSVTPPTCKIKGKPIFTPSDIVLNGAQIKNVHALIEFTDRCRPTSYQLKGTSLLFQNGKSNEVSFASVVQEFSSDINGTSDTAVAGVSTNPVANYEFKNVPKEIVVSKANEQYSFRVQLIDEENQVVSGKSIAISSYDTSYGDLESMKVVTDSKGFANFSFISPASLENINGKELLLELNYIENKSILLSTTVKLIFRSYFDTTTSSEYRFQNATSLIVGHASEKQTVSIDLLDATGVGVSGKTIKITTLDKQFGSFSSSTAQTNGAGRANFSYVSPTDFDAVDGRSTSATLTFTEDGISITQRVRISFHKSTDNTVTDKVLPTVVIPSSLRNITLTSNSKSIEIQIKVFKNIAPYAQGTVKVELPSKVLNGVDVGSFASFKVPVNEQGIATFNYTGPANLKALLDANDKSSIFKFYHSENSDEASRQEMIVNYSASADTYIPIDYTLSVNTNENDFSMGIPNLQKTFTVLLKDSKGNIIDDKDVNITKIVVNTENALVAKIFNPSRNSMVDSIELKKENNSAFILKSKKLSGIVPLKVNISFIDINGKNTELSTIVNVRVMSGPPSAISVSYVSTSQDKERAKYEEKFAVSVTDEYGNKVNTKPYISLGAIVGYTVDGQSSSSVESSRTKRLYYGKSAIENSIANGEIVTLGDEANTTHFEDNTANRSEVFKWVNVEGNNTDKLVIFGKGKNYEAMGKWDFSKIDNNTLSLEDDYFGVDRDKLYYAIGHNYYQDQCLDDGREWIGSTDSETYQLDDEGTVIVSYKYDYHLTGKDALVWVNLNGYQSDTGKNTRIGEVTKHTLRGMGLYSRPTGGYFVDKNSTDIVTFEIHHKNAPEWYRNGHFKYELVKNTCASVTIVDTINNHDARSCNNYGVAYVTFKVKALENASCNINIEKLLLTHEF